MMDKFYAATTQAAKEKQELELKKEIKKLQRLRDQIKNWITSNEIKDKTALTENKRLVEVQMEKFKVIEREMKTKAYSREGLQASKIDPKDRVKLELAQWLATAIDKLATQTDALEVRLEDAVVASDPLAHDAVCERIEKHQWHSGKLENVLRLLQTESLPAEFVQDIREDVDYYVDWNEEDDFVENDQIYDEVDAWQPASQPNSAAPGASPLCASPAESDSEGTVPFEAPPVAQDEAVAVDSAVAPLPKASAVVAPPSKQQPSSKSAVLGAAGKQQPLEASAAALPRLPMAALIAKQPPAATADASSGVLPANSPWINPKLTENLLKAKSAASGASSAAVSAAAQISALASAAVAAPAVSADSPEVAIAAEAIEALSLRDAPLPSSVAPEPTASFDKLRSAARTLAAAQSNAAILGELLEKSHAHIPDVHEFEKNKSYNPVLPSAKHPPYYPVNPPSVFENPILYDKFDVDTLFFIFYHQPRTLQQYLAAKELKKQSWRFHKKYLTWFQRFEEPRIVNDDYEQGTYIYFDYEGSWCQRKKTEFTFEYRYLEDVELP